MAPDLVLLTTSEVADLLRVDKSTIRRWAEEGKLPTAPVPGKQKRFRREDIDAMVRGEQPDVTE